MRTLKHYKTLRNTAKRVRDPSATPSPHRGLNASCPSELCVTRLCNLLILDSEIMEEAVHRATEMGIPVLPVHDELVGPISKKAEIKQILIDSFHEVTQGKFSAHEPKMTWSST